jgi:hypothetical protein
MSSGTTSENQWYPVIIVYGNVQWTHNPVPPLHTLSPSSKDPWISGARMSPQYPRIPHDERELHLPFISLVLLALFVVRRPVDPI